MGKSSRTTIAGVLEIIAGVLYLFYGFTALVSDITSGSIEVWFVLPQTWMVVLGVLTLVGGVHAAQGRNFGLALTGSLLAVPLPPFLGIPASILLVLSRNDWPVRQRRVILVSIITAGVIVLAFWVAFVVVSGPEAL